MYSYIIVVPLNAPLLKYTTKWNKLYRTFYYYVILFYILITALYILLQFYYKCIKNKLLHHTFRLLGFLSYIPDFIQKYNHLHYRQNLSEFKEHDFSICWYLLLLRVASFQILELDNKHHVYFLVNVHLPLYFKTSNLLLHKLWLLIGIPFGTYKYW